MGWPQPKNPIQTDNSIAAGIINNTLFLVGGRWWVGYFGGSVVANPKTSFVTIGMHAQKTGLITTLNTTLTLTMKPITSLMWAYGIRSTHYSSVTLTRYCLTVGPWFPHLGFSQFLFFSLSYFSTSRMLPQGCVAHLTVTMDRLFLSPVHRTANTTYICRCSSQ